MKNPVVDPQTQAPTGYYYENGTYYKVDPNTGGYMPVSAPTQLSPQNPTTGQPQAPVTATPASAPASTSTLSSKLGSINPDDYRGIINQGYANLGQPGNGDYSGTPDASGANRLAVENQFITALATDFVDRVTSKTGTPPTEDQIGQFVSQNATAANASKYITGSLGHDQRNTLVDYHLQANPDILKGTQTTQDLNGVGTLQNLSQQLPGLYSNLSDQLGGVADTAFAAPRKAAIEDEAALGRLRSPSAIANIGAVDAAKAQSLSQGRYNLGLQQLSGTQDIAKALAGAQQSQQGINNQATQFGQTKALQNKSLSAQLDQYDQQNVINQQQLAAAKQLGLYQANASSPGALQYANTGIQGLSAIASLAAALA